RFADTTAVILNWSRFPNVRTIVRALCSAELADIFREVLVWNNNPRELRYEDFGADLPCSSSGVHMRIVNSPENLYFYARYLACSSANSTHCFIQDDDYLVLPEVIRAMHSRIHERPQPSSIYLLPAHERLSSDMRHICDDTGRIHTGFSWLGHGALTHRTLISDFLALIDGLGFTDSERKMADNYFSILRNSPPETWFDQGIELGGGEPFTVGTEGDDRNRRHIIRAAQYLELAVAEDRDPPYPFIDRTLSSSCSPSYLQQARAACFGRPCVLQTSIALFPFHIQHVRPSAQQMLELEENSRSALGLNEMKFYLDNSPSNAVDRQSSSAFRSTQDGRAGDFIMLDMLSDVGSSWPLIEMVWLVDTSGAELLRQCIHESSYDGRIWTTAVHAILCFQAGNDQQECAVELGSAIPSRFFRARLVNDSANKWTVFEVWLRG
ncbi:hypothetical protein K488DRAFT_18652, partial [Vararia minispora EC-137]